MSPFCHPNPCAPRRSPLHDAALHRSAPSFLKEPTMTDQLTRETSTHTEAFEPATPAVPVVPVLPPAEAPHWTQHPAHEFPRRTGDHAPNLATLAQLRSGGRNPLLLSAKRRRQVAPKGCTQR
jgi:hypothetical protein